jgi:hypothetical protein
MKKAVSRTARLFAILDKAKNTKPVGNLNRADLYRQECKPTLDKISKPAVAFRQTRTNAL